MKQCRDPLFCIGVGNDIGPRIKGEISNIFNENIYECVWVTSGD